MHVGGHCQRDNIIRTYQVEGSDAGLRDALLSIVT
jgi:hypothetical protein